MTTAIAAAHGQVSPVAERLAPAQRKAKARPGKRRRMNSHRCAPIERVSMETREIDSHLDVRDNPYISHDLLSLAW